MLVIGGVDQGADKPNLTPQVWNIGTNQWTTLAVPSKSIVDVHPLYPWLHLAPDGKVFVSGPDSSTGFLDTAGGGTWSAGPTNNWGNRGGDAASVLYNDGKVIIVGGGSSPAPTNTAEVIDLNVTNKAWRYVSPMVSPRVYFNATILPDGKVLAIGGYTANGCCANETPSVYATEMWDPDPSNPNKETWTTLASMKIPRLYHGVALLLPDGRVFSAGGGQGKEGLPKKQAEFYSPPYLFKGPQPVISTALPASVDYNSDQITVTMQSAADADSITDVTWVRLPSVTHGFNQNQGFNRLTFSHVQGSSTLTVNAPTNRNLCPPGHYMLFAINNKGVPSKAVIIQII